ncbi:MAG: hypothetical protein WBX25_24110 [Rhodomicrobium sp.]
MTYDDVRHTQKRHVAHGSKKPGKDENWTQAIVRFDDEMFAAIRARAIAQKTSFSEQVRLLCEWGLEA